MPSTDDSDNDSDERAPGHVTTFDPAGGDEPSEAIVTAVAAVANVDPLELSPLYEVVEPGALDTLVEHAHRTGAGAHQVWFTYEGFDVGIRTDGQIRIVDETDSSVRSTA